MTKRKRTLLDVAGQARTATLSAVGGIVATTAAAGALAGVVAIPLHKYLKAKGRMY